MFLEWKTITFRAAKLNNPVQYLLLGGDITAGGKNLALKQSSSGEFFEEKSN